MNDLRHMDFIITDIYQITDSSWIISFRMSGHFLILL